MQTVLDMLKARKSVRAYEPIPVEAEKSARSFKRRSKRLPQGT